MSEVRGWARLLPWLFLIAVGFSARPGWAHDFRPAVLELDEIGPGRFVVRWQTTSALAAPGAPRYVPSFPEQCVYEGSSLDCGAQGLVGPIGVDGIETGYLDVAVQVRMLDGRRQFELLDAGHPRLEFGLVVEAEAPPPGRYFGLGLEHILAGFDHLLFVLGLTLLVGWSRRLLWTVTAFTLGHGCSLAISVVGSLRVPQAPVEAVIALSVLLLAVELTRQRETLTRRWPALVAGGFGLVHGLGFAGALREIGLPEQGLGQALAAFNAGIEAGQLLVVGVVLAGLRLLRHDQGGAQAQRWAQRMPAYAMGSLAAAWLVDRVLSFWGGI